MHQHLSKNLFCWGKEQKMLKNYFSRCNHSTSLRTSHCSRSQVAQRTRKQNRFRKTLRIPLYVTDEAATACSYYWKRLQKLNYILIRQQLFQFYCKFQHDCECLWLYHEKLFLSRKKHDFEQNEDIFFQILHNIKLLKNYVVLKKLYY